MDVDHKQLVITAREARSNAYAPYSNYTVGAAIITEDGTVFTGCNIENASYPASICAERVAITKAVSAGYKDFVAIAVATENGEAPCGICRQVMFEFAPEMRVLLVDEANITGDFILRELLPCGFGPDSLPGASLQ